MDSKIKELSENLRASLKQIEALGIELKAKYPDAKLDGKADINDITTALNCIKTNDLEQLKTLTAKYGYNFNK